MAILLAKTPEGGISAFYAPTRRTSTTCSNQNSGDLLPDSTLNGITIQRLKPKLGTRALPTVELSLQNMRAYLLGALGRGIREISTILNITRIHNAVTACRLWGRGLAISRAFARARRVQSNLLMDVPAHVRTMTEMHVDYHANMVLTFFVVALLGTSEQSIDRVSPRSRPTESSVVPENPDIAAVLLRLLAPIAKALTAKAAIAGLAECMESLGGVGYLDSASPLDIETNIARLYRDVNVLSIWEGTTDVMGSDTVRVLKGKDGDSVMSIVDRWVRDQIEASRRQVGVITDEGCDAVIRVWKDLMGNLHSKEAELNTQGRHFMQEIG